MNGSQEKRSEFALAESKLQHLGATDGSSVAARDTVSLNADVLRFGIFELDVQSLELRREGRLIHLRHQPARVLSLLLEKAGQLVSRDEITNELWPNDVDVDVEQGLNHCIKEIRAALGDRSDAPRYIQTLPRRGYRTLVDVHKVRTPRLMGSRSNDISSNVGGTVPEPGSSSRAVRITVSVSPVGIETPLWSASFDGVTGDMEKIERDFHSAFQLGLRPVLEAESGGVTGSGEESDALRWRRGFE